MILFFSVYLGWLPSSGSGTPLHLIMPAFALGWYFAAAHMRLTRSSMLEVLGSEYIKLARLKGLPQALVIGKHAFKNALIPVLTLAGINLVLMINVAVVVETVFAWPGIGRLLYEGIIVPRLPRGAGRGDHRRRHDRRGEPAGGHPLCRDRSPHPAGELTIMSTVNRSRSPAGRVVAARFSFVRCARLSADPGADPLASSRSWRCSPTCWRRTIPRSARWPHASVRRSGSKAAARDYLLGTDHFGRDVLSRLIFGARVSDGRRLHRGDLRRRRRHHARHRRPAISAAGWIR